jgi:hypothetical protein
VQPLVANFSMSPGWVRSISCSRGASWNDPRHGEAAELHPLSNGNGKDVQITLWLFNISMENHHF